MFSVVLSNRTNYSEVQKTAIKENLDHNNKKGSKMPRNKLNKKYKISLKEVKEGLNKWGDIDIPYS